MAGTTGTKRGPLACQVMPTLNATKAYEYSQGSESLALASNDPYTPLYTPLDGGMRRMHRDSPVRVKFK